jgi:hypothetical protein
VLRLEVDDEIRGPITCPGEMDAPFVSFEPEIATIESENE